MKVCNICCGKGKMGNREEREIDFGLPLENYYSWFLSVELCRGYRAEIDPPGVNAYFSENNPHSAVTQHLILSADPLPREAHGTLFLLWTAQMPDSPDLKYLRALFEFLKGILTFRENLNLDPCLITYMLFNRYSRVKRRLRATTDGRWVYAKWRNDNKFGLFLPCNCDAPSTDRCPVYVPLGPIGRLEKVNEDCLFARLFSYTADFVRAMFPSELTLPLPCLDRIMAIESFREEKTLNVMRVDHARVTSRYVQGTPVSFSEINWDQDLTTCDQHTLMSYYQFPENTPGTFFFFFPRDYTRRGMGEFPAAFVVERFAQALRTESLIPTPALPATLVFRRRWPDFLNKIIATPENSWLKVRGHKYVYGVFLPRVREPLRRRKGSAAWEAVWRVFWIVLQILRTPSDQYLESLSEHERQCMAHIIRA